MVGAPARLFVGSLVTVAVIALYLATTSAERLQRLTNFTNPFKDYQGAGWQPAHGLFAMSSGGLFGKGISASQQKWGALPEAHTDFIFAVLGEELGLVGTLLVLALFLTHRLRRHPGGGTHQGPVHPLHVGGHHDLADRADDDQHRDGARRSCR